MYIDIEEVFTNYKNCFEAVYNYDAGLTETLECHIMATHAYEFIFYSGDNMNRCSDEAIEFCHSRLKKSELRHNFKATKDLTSKSTQMKANSSWDYINAKNMRSKRKK